MRATSIFAAVPTARFPAALAVLLAISLAFGTPARAQGESDVTALWAEDPGRVFDASEIDLSEFEWIARPVVVFANAPQDPSFIEQMEQIESDVARLIERDVVIVIDTDPAGDSDLRRRLRPRGFMLVLIGKDGQVNLRKPLPWTVREISRSIDKTPMRQREMHGG